MIGNIEYKENTSLVGRIIITTPTKPIITADHLYIPILCCRRKIDNMIIKNGEEKVRVDAVAKFIFMMAT